MAVNKANTGNGCEVYLVRVSGMPHISAVQIKAGEVHRRCTVLSGRIRFLQTIGGLSNI
jgi:hypothetical protein